ncbi:hypothetical protein QUB25_01415 [Microcoleus sp. B3-D7]
MARFIWRSLVGNFEVLGIEYWVRDLNLTMTGSTTVSLRWMPEDMSRTWTRFPRRQGLQTQ